MSNWYATDAGGNEFKTKKALREYAAEHPNEVRLEDASLINSRGTVRGLAQLSQADVIVGPNPWRARNWYANVKNGRVV